MNRAQRRQRPSRLTVGQQRSAALVGVIAAARSAEIAAEDWPDVDTEALYRGVRRDAARAEHKHARATRQAVKAARKANR